MIEPKEWVATARREGNWGTENFYKRIQADALRHAAQLVHDMSRGTKSANRAKVIDEARDLIADEAKTVSLSQTVTAQSNADLTRVGNNPKP